MGANVQGLILKSSETMVKDDVEYLVETWVDLNGRVRSVTESSTGEDIETTPDPTQIDRIEAQTDYIAMMLEG